MRDGTTEQVGSVLLVGCGREDMPQWRDQGYAVLRLDIEPRTEPDVCASMTAMGDIGPFDVVFCSHALEHLYPHEVPQALSEFRRVLKPGGIAMIVVPDLEDVRPTEDVLPNCFGMSGLHLYYGDAAQIEEFPHMAHHSGFVRESLQRAMEAAGFAAQTKREGHYQLISTGVRQ